MGHVPHELLTAPTKYALAPGTPITLSPAAAPSVLCLAEVLAWATSPSGLVVTARAATDPGSAGQLSRQHVFITGRTSDDALLVLEAVAQQSPEEAGVLELVSVAALAREHRRASVRATVSLPAVLDWDEPDEVDPSGGTAAPTPAPGIAGITLDLSADGCRLRLERDHGPPVGTPVRAVLNLSPADPIRVTGVVVRSAAHTPEIIISFDPLPGSDAAAIDATVYAALRA